MELKYDRLTVIRKLPNDKDGNIIYECRCVCGTIKAVRKFCLTSGNTRSCGCLAKETARLKNWKGCGEISGQVFLVFKKNAAQRNIPFEVDIKYIYDLYLKQDGKCALTGLPIPFGKNNRSKRDASLDRIDSAKGYIKGNVRWVHKVVNKMKSNMSDDELFIWCEHILNGR